jgi:hypothetical protein
MSHRRRLIVFLGASLLLIPKVAPSQSLGEVARELRQERAKHPAKAVKVYTNDNIVKSETGPLSSAETAPAAAEAGETKISPAPQPLEQQTKNAIKTKEYWQARFSAARAVLSRAKEEQRLVEDELSLLQIQRVRELDPNRSKELRIRVNEKADELKTKREATEKAQKALNDLKKEFKQSGAPEDWIGNGSPP